LARRDRKGSLNDGHIQNPSEPFGIVPLYNFVPRGFGFVHHSIAILDHEVPNPHLTIRHFFHCRTAVPHTIRGLTRSGYLLAEDTDGQVRFCRYQVFPTDEFKYRGARRVRTQCPLYKRPLLFIIRFNC
jgi:hypothetical protein